ncbi:MAG TPA: (d)CMP kinase [Niabella sp.]|nr:(d)CMP kinase [Niabella sp.]HOZ98146.1 (d)CMP kinase [Niabella sp.]HQW16173.1 (d)CMP kinase [Niabella sp.]HQX21385.1 (d)CMP kinase [Niabella sp.]HQX41211.1 (d)CMP kinase [Niabella sp.]
MGNKKIIIAIDGLSSCGKSTIARQLAGELNYLYVDSGAMYRAITLYFLRNNVDMNDATQVENALREIELDFRFNENSGQMEMFLNDEDVEYQIRDLIVAEKVSEVATLKAVRDFAVIQQQKLGNGKGVIMDGRDIGTVVFPQAELKLYMTADSAVRVERRFKEMYEKNPNVTIEEVAQNIEMRDYIDANREVSPLRKATDAIVINNSNLSPADQLKKVLDLANSYIQN